MSTVQPGISNLTPLMAASYITSLPLLVAYCISAPIISVLFIILSSGAFFSSNVPKSKYLSFILGIGLFIGLWVVPGHARKGSSFVRLFYLFLSAGIFYITRNPLILLNIVIISSKWWWWLFREEIKWSFISLWGHIPKLIIFAATVFLSLNIIK